MEGKIEEKIWLLVIFFFFLGRRYTCTSTKPGLQAEKNRAHHKYKKNIAMTNCLVILYPAWRQSVIAISFLYLWCARFFFRLQSGLSIFLALVLMTICTSQHIHSNFFSQTYKFRITEMLFIAWLTKEYYDVNKKKPNKMIPKNDSDKYCGFHLRACNLEPTSSNNLTVRHRLWSSF